MQKNDRIKKKGISATRPNQIKRIINIENDGSDNLYVAVDENLLTWDSTFDEEGYYMEEIEKIEHDFRIADEIDTPLGKATVTEIIDSHMLKVKFEENEFTNFLAKKCKKI